MSKIALVQTNIKDYDLEANYDLFSSLLRKVDKDTSLVVLPEMFISGFVSDVTLAEQSMNLGLRLMRDFVQKTKITIEGSLLVKDRDKYYNRHYIIGPSCSKHYDKQHLFSLSDEARVLSAGTQNDVVFDLDGLKIKILTCFDLRFPLCACNKYKNGEFLYDMLIYVASWPESRRSQWLALLKARAIENQCYVVGVNRTGTDHNGVTYSGDSCVADVKGEFLTRLSCFENTIFYYEADKAGLSNHRKRFPVYLQWD